MFDFANHHQINHLFEHLNNDLEHDSDFLAIFFSLSQEHFAIASQTDFFSQYLSPHYPNLSPFELEQLQYNLLAYLHQLTSQSMPQILQKTLQKLSLLQTKNLTSSKAIQPFCQSIQALLDKSMDSHIQRDFEEDFKDLLNDGLAFLSAQKELVLTIQTLTQQCLDQKLQTLLNQIKEQKFSLGVTGVLSAGKSTFLNALLGQAILGSSTIPETANLTILRYGNYGASIEFWNQKEWEETKCFIPKDQFKALMHNPSFLEALHDYIKPQNHHQNISIDKLALFTSANAPIPFCYLVKSTTLTAPLNLLEQNVSLIDTPGLDDPIIQREEITKACIQKCDVLIHAMNASQAATQIDIDFIIQTLRHGNIISLLVVLTHADLLSQEELAQSLQYTKESLQKQLIKELPPSEVPLFLNRLVFLPVASYPALLCQTNKDQASKQGFIFDKTGLPQVQQFLYDTLLSPNSTKAKDILYLATKGFYQIISDLKDNLSLKQQLLTSSKEEKQRIAQSLSSQKQAILQALKQAKEELAQIQSQIQDFLSHLAKSIDFELFEANTILAQRTYDEIIYAYQKNTKPKQERLEQIIKQGVLDACIDTIRQYKYKLNQKLQKIQEQTKLFCKQQSQPHFAFEFHNSHLHLISQAILDALLPLIPNYNKHQSMQLLQKIEQIFGANFSSMQEQIIKQGHHLERDLMDYLNQASQEHFATLQEQIKQKERILEESLAPNQDQNNQELSKSLQQQQQNLTQSLQKLQALLQACTKSPKD